MIVVSSCMELQLGLALPNSSSKGFDLNYHANEPKGSESSWGMQGSPCYNGINEYDQCKSQSNINNRKRGFQEAFHDEHPRTLSLLHWNNQPNYEDDQEDIDNKDSSSAASNIINDEDGDSVLGWPPIKSSRKKICYYQNNLTVKNACGCSDGARSNMNSTYVKVKMEGVAIARKVDLSVCSSYQMLKETLMDMFSIWKEDSNDYRLAYQDTEGDWLLAQDIPWRSFIQSVQRLKLMKSSP